MIKWLRDLLNYQVIVKWVRYERLARLPFNGQVGEI
jgi:hypothetical protein